MKPYRKVAIVGAGITKFIHKAKETPKELAWAAAKMTLESCNMKLSDVDAVVHGTAPDAFDGVHMKGEYLAEASGGWNKPYLRCYVGGGTGVFAPAQAWLHIASGAFDTCLAVCEEKMSNCQPHPQGAFLTIFDNFLERPLKPNLLWIFSLEMNRYMSTYGLKIEDIAPVSVKNKNNALDHPSAQAAEPVTLQDVLNSEIMAWPVHRLMVSPTSDGAAAVLLASEEKARQITDKPVWIEGVGWNLDTAYWTNRDLCYPQYVEKAVRMAYEMADIKEPKKEIHIAEPYDPFAYKELHHMEGLLLCDKGKAPEDLALGRFDRQKGSLPACPSGGLLGVGNPIAAAGMMKVCELFWQLRGEAGKRQVPGQPKKAVAQAWGDLMQVGTVLVCGVN
ncbi:MAG: thiolase domain-containing protein [Elusimicrobia bacterium]|nr:thiolase domain-containing protein [Elusimicrobiota bacterium]